MNSAVKNHRKKEIEIYLTKYPESKCKDVKKWLLSGDQKFDFSEVSDHTLNCFIIYNINKFQKKGQCVEHSGGNSQKKQLQLPE